MPSIHETAYPRLKSSVTAKELNEIYTPTADELALAGKVARGGNARLCFLLLLKTFQRLGYFAQLRDVPLPIIKHITHCLGEQPPVNLFAYDESGTRRRHVPVIRQHLNVRPYDKAAQELLTGAVREAAKTKEDLADIINVGIEELIRQRVELPGFTTLLEEAQRGRAEVNRVMYQRVTDAMGESGRLVIDRLLAVDPASRRAPWQALKGDPGRPTLTHLRELVEHLRWLKSQNVDAAALTALPAVKVRHFAAEANSLDAARMQEMEAGKRYTLAAALITMQVARALDDLGEMFIKRMLKIQHRAQAALADFRQHHQGRTEQLVMLLRDLLTVMQTEGTAEERLAAMRALVGDQPESVIDTCQAYTAYADNNYAPFLWQFYKSHRQALFALLDHVELVSTSHDTSLTGALAFLREHRTSKGDWLKLPPPVEKKPDDELSTSSLALSWVTDKWWKLITGYSNREMPPSQIDRRHFEVCVFSQMLWELKSGDLAIVGSEKFADYREQLISWDEYERTIKDYGEQAGLIVDGEAFVQYTGQWLEETATATDATFLNNESLRIENGEPVLSRLEKQAVPEQLKLLEQLMADRIEPMNILDALADTESWLNWTRFFGPLSGYEGKLGEPRSRYVTASFCYGCNLGPTQTSKSLAGLDRRQIAWINQRHITEQKLDEAITEIINAYNLFSLPRHWGSGKHASADGTKWNLYEQNLLSEYHIRYGGYGGIGYYHVSDTYVALFSHFIPCGVWEAVYILDGLLKNQSDIQPDTLHADTQGQSTAVFGLAHLLGINLMPRIRNWKDLKLFRPSKEARYTHIGELFAEEIDWQLIQTHLPDLLRVVLSIRAGRITAATLLRKLGTYSRKNKLYQAMRELGRVVRTVFLLRYLADPALRRTIQAATNKSEAFNKFIQWVFFGGEGMIAENNRDEQRKLIKYNHLVANCLIFHNVYSMTRVLHQLAQEGHQFEDAAFAHLSPYLTGHINRFGSYTLNLDRKMPLPEYDLLLKPGC